LITTICIVATPVALALVSNGCSRSGAPSPPLEVFCGAGLSEPMEQLCRAFGEESGAEVRVSYGGSGVLMAKLAIGQAAERILRRSDLADRVHPNVRVRTATVNQLVLYLLVGQVDAAILWEDLVRRPSAEGKLRAVAIPAEQNAICTIAAARGTRSARPALAEAFIGFLVSERAAAVWQKWGFAECAG
jgi:ABC-type molybdate transport system substrate-binding protein